MILKYPALLFAVLLMASCGDHNKTKAAGTWFGGEIINPVDHIVTLRKGNKVVAEIPMDQNNRFLFQLKNLEPGLYEFNHKERQLVYLEQGDSIMLRVNTFDFDESLTFSGYGADENNMLIDLFLKNEYENAYMAREDIYQESPEHFEHFLDSLFEKHNEWKDEYKNASTFSPQFQDFLKATIDYDLYARKEVYPMIKISDSKSTFINDLPIDFYAYRKDLTFDHGDYLPCYAYRRFLINYFNQAALKKYAGESTYDTQSFLHNFNEIKLIDSLVPDQDTKSYLITRSLRSYLGNNEDLENGKKLYELYLRSDPNPSDKEEMDNMFHSFNNIAPNKPIPNETLINAQLQPINLREMIKRPTVLYFWSSRRVGHMRRSSAKAETLRQHFPQYDVMGINMDDDHVIWLRSLALLNSPKDFAYQFKDNAEKVRVDMALNSILKTIIVDKNGMILEAHANMFSEDFEEKLLGYLNR